ncbi:hypothetical protein [Methanofollis ethanolicus]|uniref:hypothetical protein n=1 Tax=Methanofollis ethanolicus TaxID=488124 RepID=UPI000830A156|nr:hypothetical protein [Methanofollis ethanolicus]
MIVDLTNTVPDDRTYFKVPFGPLLPLVGAGSCIPMLVTLPLSVLAAGGAALLAGTLFFVIEDTPEGERAAAEIREFIGKERR